jgi:hypothetical protein
LHALLLLIVSGFCFSVPVGSVLHGTVEEGTHIHQICGRVASEYTVSCPVYQLRTSLAAIILSLSLLLLLVLLFRRMAALPSPKTASSAVNYSENCECKGRYLKAQVQSTADLVGAGTVDEYL